MSPLWAKEWSQSSLGPTSRRRDKVSSSIEIQNFNNETKYEVLLIGLQGAKDVMDTLVVVNLKFKLAAQ